MKDSQNLKSHLDGCCKIIVLKIFSILNVKGQKP